MEQVLETARKLTAAGKGILAIDESTVTVGKRLKAVGLENNEETRRAYRELFFTAKGIGQYLSGAILFEETLYQSTSDGVPFVQVLTSAGILPGIKADKGLVEIPGTNGESATAGLDGLGQRCAEYYSQGARFAKWRALIKILPHGHGCPSPLAVQLTADSLARYASVCQQHGLLPIVEPEILIDGQHSIERSAEVAEVVLTAVVHALHVHKVVLEGVLIKPQMIMPGFDNKEQKVSAEEVASITIRTFQRTVPAAVPGIMFLSGGQSEEEATEHLNALNLLKQREGASAPWKLSFSFGRALQASVLRLWAGKAENAESAKELAVQIARVNGLATLGEYPGPPHPSSCADDLREGFRGWTTTVA
eukprot:TRINITY_DN5580_c0_g1_i1.p1 TRINITY_DN5580_c0_g1~~TRINITY_DN5580_c0_g1_i1.p1  ORF type:complete len:364 (+),score=84.82 TRINITY_DN5580_c0_g1_i1:254-1345(+)